MNEKLQKEAIERLTGRIVMHGKKTNQYVSEDEARKKAIHTQRRYQINKQE